MNAKFRLRFYLLFFFLLLSAFSSILPQPKTSVTFEVTIGDYKPGLEVFITGGMNELGNWNPNIIRMDSVRQNVYSKTIKFVSGTSLEFKFTAGDWEHEAIYEKGKTPRNFNFKVAGDTLLSYYIPFWKDDTIRKVVGKVTGKVIIHRDFKGYNLKPRDISVWLPPDYDMDHSTMFPVLYMHDGQNIFDPATSSFGIDWQIDECADSLIRQKRIKSVIIVGINNTPDRGDEYANTDLGSNYMKLLVNVIKPFIDKTYRTKTDRKNTATAGSSLGGLIAFMLAWEYPDVFSKAACFSPAFKIQSLDYVTEVERYSGIKKDILLYIDDGGVGLEELLQPGIDDMMKAIEKKGFKKDKDYFWIKDTTAEHNEAAWAKRIINPLMIFYGK